MKPEEFEVYIIPPNFMEGGTLFGGLLKTRNTIEAVILGLAVGVPVLRLPFSLTVRVVILCLTALPLVLLALIGVSGMSLSAFIRLFFCFLHNRRILSRDGTQDGKNEKALLPSWAQHRKTGREAEDPPLPKSRSRFSVDLKQRSVTQFKTFLQEEESVQPLNALADYIPIEKIEHGVIYTRDHRYVKVVEVIPVNFLLRSAREQRSIIYSFISYLKIAPVKVQFKALTKRADINRHLDTVRKELEQERDPHCRALQKDYLKLIRKLGSREAITRRFFLIFEYEPLPGTKRGHEEEDAIASLQTAARTAANYLRQCGNEVISPENEDNAAAEILYNILCRRASSEPFYQRVKSVLADYMASGRDINTIPVNEFYAPDRIDLSHGSYLQKQDRLVLCGEYYRIPSEMEDSIDLGLSKAVWVLADFMEQVEYHSVSDYPAKIIFFADDEVYEIIYVEPGKEQLINQMLSSVKEVPPKYIILVEHPEQIAAIHTPNTGGYCTVSSSGEVQYYQIE